MTMIHELVWEVVGLSADADDAPGSSPLIPYCKLT